MTLYQLPFSPWLRQMVTCRTPTRILCAGLDMVWSPSLEFPAPPRGLTGATTQPPGPGFTPTGRIVRPVPDASGETEGSRLGKNHFLVKAVSPLAAGGQGCRFARVRPRWGRTQAGKENV